MELNKKYVRFIVENLFEDMIMVRLVEPDIPRGSVQKGMNAYMKVGVKILNEYTRSVNVKLMFDKYTIEKIVFLPIESAPFSIYDKFKMTVAKLVNETMIADGRGDEIKEMYTEKRRVFNDSLKSIVTAIKKHDEKAKNDSSISNRIVD